MTVLILPRGSIIPIIDELAIIYAWFNKVNTQAAVIMDSLNPACLLKMMPSEVSARSLGFRKKKQKSQI